MTADAKVGLLLGLFFIVLIAFLINGLPTFLQTSTADDVVKTTIVAPSGPDLVIDNRVTETAQRLIPGIPLRATEPPQEVIVLDQSAQTAVTPAAETPVVEAPITTPQPEAVSVIAAQANQLSLPTPQPSKAVAANTRRHVVEKNETLASIAQKYYGPEEGNRRVVIQQLYEANKDVMPSPDVVVVGKKLTIPPLTKSTHAKSSASETLLQKFSGVFEQASSEPQAKPVRTAAAGKTTEYVTQSGDTLWKIAEKTLGDGGRYNELFKLNKGRLKSPDTVIEGIKILIPAP